MGNRMKKYQPPSRRGFTLLELIIAAVIVGILSVGALGYEYHAMRNVRHAEVQVMASQVGKTILDVWKGLRGVNYYDPATLLGTKLAISSSAIGPTPGADSDGGLFTTLGRYQVVSDAVTFYVTCSYKEPSVLNPKTLNVAVAWRKGFQAGNLNTDAFEVRYSTFYGDN